MVGDRGIRVDVYMKLADSKAVERLKATGVEVEHIDSHFKRVTCIIPFDLIEEIGKDDNITGIHGIALPVSEIGTYTSAGDNILNAATVRSTYNIDGSNIKVGILSDGVDHYTNAISAGDLPSGFQVVSNSVSGDEGTAMAEIVHDVAPGASLAFADYGSSESSFASHITSLRNAGCDVIVDDVVYFSEPVFEDGTIALAVDDATANGIKYISSAGNRGSRTWSGQSADANSNTWMEFSGSTEVNSITVQPGDGFYAVMQWANKWGLSNDDYDLYLFSGPETTSQVLASSTDVQNGTGNPYEIIGWDNPDQNARTVYLRVKFSSVQSPRVVKILLFLTSANLNYYTEGGVNPHASASSCISVGAINAASPQTIASYSSHGPSRIYTYDANGYPVSYVERQTPTLCGIDGVQTYVGMSGLWNGQSNFYFYGTSAAAPHIAGIAALLLSKQGAMDWDEAQQQLILAATKVSGMGGQSFTNGYGYGRADAYEGIRNLYVPQGHSTVESAASVATSGQTISVSAGNYSINDNVTISSGAVLQIASGSSLSFSSATNFELKASSLLAARPLPAPVVSGMGLSSTMPLVMKAPSRMRRSRTPNTASMSTERRCRSIAVRSVITPEVCTSTITRVLSLTTQFETMIMDSTARATVTPTSSVTMCSS